MINISLKVEKIIRQDSRSFLGTTRLCEGHLGIKYAGEKHWTSFHIDYGNNTLGPHVECDDFMNLSCFYCFDDVDEGMAPIRMVPNNEPEESAVPMIVPGGSVCLYSVFTRHAASEFIASTGHRPTMWVGFTRKDRGWDGGRSFTYKSGATATGMGRFIADASPRQPCKDSFGPPLLICNFMKGQIRTIRLCVFSF